MSDKKQPDAEQHEEHSKICKVWLRIKRWWLPSAIMLITSIGLVCALSIPQTVFQTPSNLNDRDTSTSQNPGTPDNKETSHTIQSPSNSDNRNTPVLLAQSNLRLAFLYITGGAIAVMGLIETFRKNNNEKLKNDQEKEKNDRDHLRQVRAGRRERYTKAVEQLGDEKAPIRMGGVYTLVGLIDEWLEDESIDKYEDRLKEGQVIINNLCAYIRSPFTLASHYDELSKANPTPKGIYKGKKEKFYADKATLKSEADVRCGIIKGIHDRLQAPEENTPGTWSDFEYDFSGSTFFYPIDLTNSCYTKPINFSGSTYKEGADFRGSTYQGEANFGESTYEQDVIFSTLGSPSTYQEQADFRHSTYQGQANFDGSTHQDFASFDGSIYQGQAGFVGSTYTDWAGFSGSTYQGEAIFDGSTYNTNVAAFSGSTYHGGVYFSGSTYQGQADFSHSTYHGGVYFSGSTYQWAYFSNSIYQGQAVFIVSTYQGWGVFSGSIFNSDIYFGKNRDNSFSIFTESAPQFYYETNRINTLFGSPDNNFTVENGRGYPIYCNLEGLPLGCKFLTSEQKEYLEDKFQEIEKINNKILEAKDDGEKAKLLDTLRSVDEKLYEWRKEVTIVKVEDLAAEDTES